MEFTCLSRGGCFYFPPCHMLEVCGFRIQFDCPMDFSALPIFSPVPLDFYVISDEELSTHPGNGSFNFENVSEEKIENPLDVGSLIKAEPWYKIINNLRLWNPSFTDIVLISSPMGMLGLPFLTREKDFSAKIYATEATARLGKMMMDDLVAMHMEFKQFYGSEDDATPQWMRQEELELLHHALKEVAFGQDEADLGGWMPMYSAADVKDCMKKVETVRYGEEACYNGALVIKALSSGLEIGACNWTINGPKRNIAYISSSIFSSSNAMNFDYLALQEETIIYSDFSSVESMNDILNDTSGPLTDNLTALSSNEETLANLLSDPAESVGESERLSFICSCAVQSVESGGSVLIPINRLGVTLQLLEQISASLDYSNLKVPIYLISSVAEELLAFANVIPEWLSKQRQQKLFSGEPMFAFVDLLKEKRLHVFPAVHSPNLLINWQEPCVVFCPHWSLRLGPVVHLLRRWCGDPSSLLVLEGLDAELALLPFRPMSMKVLQCAFLSGIKLDKVRPLLKVLQPKVVMLPENLSRLINTNTESFTVFSYSEGETLRVPNLKDSLELEIAPDLAMSFCWRKLQQGNIDIARLKGELSLNCGKFKLLAENAHVATDQRALIHWGQPDLKKLLNVLSKMGIEGSLQQSDAESSNVGVIRIHGPTEAVIEIQESRTIISVADKKLSARIFDAVDSILDGV
ncbi:integrator complex subunit 9 homolog isoform X3 [Cucurbita pepo subsp. pepo]|uniref:integrator complex subunit 9 homolog isoform X3 n=1 Tax=Cucurbita pepo subsp. pepo TaxID=3664 RepID=UPI000C9D32B4|nr:integrator complex subunit 9 homolog isoform X3 [Cucurbita pepo subsp. pepo]